MAVIGFLVVRGFDAFKESIAGVREDFREKCDEITEELRVISKRVTDNSEAVSCRLSDMDRRLVRMETKLERCKNCGNPD